MKSGIFALAQHETLREQHLHQAFQIAAVLFRQIDPERIEIVEFGLGQPPRRRRGPCDRRIGIETRSARIEGLPAKFLGQWGHGRNAEFLLILHKRGASGTEQERDVFGVHGLGNRLAGALDPLGPIEFRWISIAVPQKLEFASFFHLAHMRLSSQFSYLAAPLARLAISAH